MKDFHVYNDIAKRTSGEIYIGVVGPVRTGKSTFIRRFMEQIVIPNMEDGPDKKRTRDELPQAASGKVIMTMEPKFIPTKAAEIKLEEKTAVKIRLIDCVGFMAEGATGHQDEDKERLVHTPWFDYDIPFTKAAETGTKKVIEEHSTIGVVVTTDGTVTELDRSAYVNAEEMTVNELKKHKKPFVIILNSKQPEASQTKAMVHQLEEKYQVSVIAMNCAEMTVDDIKVFMQKILLEFPVSSINIKLPAWFKVLELENPVKASAIDYAGKVIGQIALMKDAEKAAGMELPKIADEIVLENTDLAAGSITYVLRVKPEVYYKVLSEYSGVNISSETMLFNTIKEYADMRSQYQKVAFAMESVSQKGYGVVSPERSQITLEDPVVVKHGNRYGVRMRAEAMAVHMIQSTVETEIAPIVGSQKQAEDLVQYIVDTGKQNGDGIWSANIFGKSIGQIVEDGLSAKISQMTDECQQKLQEALEKIINDNNGGMICIII